MLWGERLLGFWVDDFSVGFVVTGGSESALTSPVFAVVGSRRYLK